MISVFKKGPAINLAYKFSDDIKPVNKGGAHLP